MPFFQAVVEYVLPSNPDNPEGRRVAHIPSGDPESARLIRKGPAST